MSVTISDVAKKAGVSPATVSKYLNRKAVSPKTHQRIEDAIQELNYQVNDFARGLRTNTSEMIGLLVWSVDNIFATSLFEEIGNKLLDFNYSLMLYSYNKSADLLAEKIAFLRQRRVDGIIIQLGGSIFEKIAPMLLELQKDNIPFVLVNGQVEGVEADVVTTDIVETIYGCTAHLLANGHRKIGMIMSPASSYKVQERRVGFLRAYADAGLTADESLLFAFDDGGDWPRVSKAEITQFLQSHPEITALILPGYYLTIASVHAIHSIGRKIGKDIALIGTNCDMLNDILDPPVTYTHVPANKIAANAIELLIDAIQHKEKRPPRLILVPGQRIDGNSVFSI